MITNPFARLRKISLKNRETRQAFNEICKSLLGADPETVLSIRAGHYDEAVAAFVTTCLAGSVIAEVAAGLQTTLARYGLKLTIEATPPVATRPTLPIQEKHKSRIHAAWTTLFGREAPSPSYQAVVLEHLLRLPLDP